MSVLECAKWGCDNIMCSRYSPEHGYICPTCFSTLVGLGTQQDISEFLSSYSASSVTDAWDHFDGIFKMQGKEEDED